jgi:hypothetical protein
MSNKSKLFIDRKSISHFRMKKMKPVRVVQREIEDVSRYVVPYTGKRHNTSQAEIDAFQKYQHEVSENMT